MFVWHFLWGFALSECKELKLKELLLFPAGKCAHVLLISLRRYWNKPGLGALFNFLPEWLATKCWAVCG